MGEKSRSPAWKRGVEERQESTLGHRFDAVAKLRHGFVENTAVHLHVVSREIHAGAAIKQS